MTDVKYELNNVQIDHYCRSKYGVLYGGCVAKDRLPRVANKFYIINMMDHTGGGSHWLLLYNCSPTNVVYFDSYAEPPPTQIQRWMQKTGKQIVESRQELQGMGSPWCGYWCLAAVECLHEGHSLKQFIDLWSANPVKNDKRIAVWAKAVWRQLA